MSMDSFDQERVSKLAKIMGDAVPPQTQTLDVMAAALMLLGFGIRAAYPTKESRLAAVKAAKVALNKIAKDDPQ